MTKEDIYYYCTSCRHVHLRNSEIGRLHIDKSFKTQKQKKEMALAEKGIDPADFKLEKSIKDKIRKHFRK